MTSTVQNIFNSLYSAVVTAQKNVEKNHLGRIREDYFNKDGSPKMVSMVLSDKKVEIPLFTLVQHHGLKISDVEIDFEIALDHDKDAVGDLGKRRDDKMANIKIKFTGTDKAEGLARIGDNLTKLIPTL
jgi:hypothetical protein|tara:strand:- start:945 stop:1331 length:387 start_codon:yes stop_codon:yes gene_type:complete